MTAGSTDIWPLGHYSHGHGTMKQTVATNGLGNSTINLHTLQKKNRPELQILQQFVDSYSQTTMLHF